VSLTWTLDSALSDESKNKLANRFTMEEIKDAIFSMKTNKASGPDGFPIEFYRNFWSLIAEDIFCFVSRFLRW
jgi:hypothetical protein